MLTLQNPIGSGFGAASTASDVISGLDLSGRVAIVTGDYSGLSLETTRALLSAGAKVTVPRDHNRAASALDGLDGVQVEAMDLIATLPLWHPRRMRLEGARMRSASWAQCLLA